jgi:predicted amidohydrolase YtcJ
MLIRQAEIDFHLDCGARRVDLRIEAGRIQALAHQLTPWPGEPVLEAQGRALLPGLHDHHLHLAAFASALDSLRCGPPEIINAEALAEALHARADRADEDEWIRGIGYHESVAGNIDRAWLDRIVPHRPLRIQQRSGRLWILNTLALERIGLANHPDGRLLDADDDLRARLPRGFPSLRRASTLLASYGVTGITDATPSNDRAQFGHFAAARASNELIQDLLVMGNDSLDSVAEPPGLWRGPRKIHLHEHALPLLDDLVTTMRRSHLAGRPVAVHCVTVTELVFALGALEMAGSHPGDRIEHAALTPSETLPLLRERGVTVVSQPNFIFERGDVYRQEVDPCEHNCLYRLHGLQAAGIPLAGSTDAPFGAANPWQAMQAAVERRSRQGAALGLAEALTAEAALCLFLTPLQAPGATPRRIETGIVADLCLLDRCWQQARDALGDIHVMATYKAGILANPNHSA